MFTGIIESTAQVRKPAQLGSPELVLATPTSWAKDLPVLGESVAVDGACLTITRCSTEEMSFDLNPETLERTALKRLASGSRVNLERALKLGDRLSGHWVQGHVDGLGRLVSARPAGDDCTEMTFELPRELGLQCVLKGSICIQGVSLTLNSVQDSGATTTVRVMIIPHTWSATSLSELKAGDPVAIETDILAKYVERLCKKD